MKIGAVDDADASARISAPCAVCSAVFGCIIEPFSGKTSGRTPARVRGSSIGPDAQASHTGPETSGWPAASARRTPLGAADQKRLTR